MALLFQAKHHTGNYRNQLLLSELNSNFIIERGNESHCIVSVKNCLPLYSSGLSLARVKSLQCILKAAVTYIQSHPLALLGNIVLLPHALLVKINKYTYKYIQIHIFLIHLSFVVVVLEYTSDSNCSFQRLLTYDDNATGSLFMNSST